MQGDKRGGKRQDEDPNSELNVLRREVRELQAQLRVEKLKSAAADEEATGLRGLIITYEEKIDDGAIREAQLRQQLDAQRVRRQRLESTLVAAESLVTALRDMAIDDVDNDQVDNDGDVLDDDGDEDRSDMDMPLHIDHMHTQSVQSKSVAMNLHSAAVGSTTTMVTSSGAADTNSLFSEFPSAPEHDLSHPPDWLPEELHLDRGMQNQPNMSVSTGQSSFNGTGNTGETTTHIETGEVENEHDQQHSPEITVSRSTRTNDDNDDDVEYGDYADDDDHGDDEGYEDECYDDDDVDNNDKEADTIQSTADAANEEDKTISCHQPQSTSHTDVQREPPAHTRTLSQDADTGPVGLMISATGGILRRHSVPINDLATASSRTQTLPPSVLSTTVDVSIGPATTTLSLLRNAFGSANKRPVSRTKKNTNSPLLTTPASGVTGIAPGATAAAGFISASSPTAVQRHATGSQQLSPPSHARPRRRTVPDAHTGDIFCVASSDDGRWIATSGDDKSICIYNQAIEPTSLVSGLSKSITALAFVQTAGSSNVNLQSLGSHAQSQARQQRIKSSPSTFTSPLATTTSAASDSAHGYMLLGGGSDGVFRVFRPMVSRRNKVKWTTSTPFTLHTGCIRRLHSSVVPSSSSSSSSSLSSCRVLSCSYDRHIKICDLEQLRWPTFSVCSSSPVLDVDFLTSDWSCLVSAHKDGSVRLVSTRDSSPIVCSVKQHGKPVVAVKCVRDDANPNANANLVVSISRDHVLRVSDVRMGILSTVRDLDLGCLTTSEWHRLHSRNRLVAAGHDYNGQVRIWNVDSGKVVKTLDPALDSPDQTDVLAMVSSKLRDPGGIVVPHWTSSGSLICAHRTRQVSIWDM